MLSQLEYKVFDANKGPEWLVLTLGYIHWAGTETSSIWNGYIKGAIRSGERVAAKVFNIL